eukprot:Awhi_evm1s12060
MMRVIDPEVKCMVDSFLVKDLVHVLRSCGLRTQGKKAFLLERVFSHIQKATDTEYGHFVSVARALYEQKSQLRSGQHRPYPHSQQASQPMSATQIATQRFLQQRQQQQQQQQQQVNSKPAHSNELEELRRFQFTHIPFYQSFQEALPPFSL